MTNVVVFHKRLYLGCTGEVLHYTVVSVGNHNSESLNNSDDETISSPDNSV